MHHSCLWISKMKIIGKIEMEDIVDIKCDICNLSTRDEFGGFEYAELSARWSYPSSKDGEYHEVCLCEKCYDKVIAYIKSLGGEVSVTEY